MNRDEFYYDLPEHLIAQEPLRERDQARLMVIDRKSGKIRHEHFHRVVDYLPPRSVIVLNDSRVVPARLLGRKDRSGGKVEIFLLSRLSDGYTYEALLRPLKKIRTGDKIIFDGSRLTAYIVDAPKRLVKFNFKNIAPHLERIGHIPLPPYIKRPDTDEDKTTYQTVYARRRGSVAAPTAGLHFTKPLLTALRKAGHEIYAVTLHINYATFKLVEEEDITRHRMHFEDYAVSRKSMQAILRAKKEGRDIIAVGTTSCRAMESVAQGCGLKGKTDLFIYPGYGFQMVDGLITNFHLPYSSLLMLVYAFGSTPFMKKAYQEAVARQYRFFSYGDAMMIV